MKLQAYATLAIVTILLTYAPLIFATNAELLTNTYTNSIASYTDGNFTSGWTDIAIIVDDPRIAGTGPKTSSATVSVQNGGNPDIFRQSVNRISYGDRVLSGGKNSTYIFNPQSSGPISTIDFKADFIQSSGGDITGGYIIIEQNGVVYYSEKYIAFDRSNWTNRELKGLTALDFDSNPNIGIPGNSNGQHPDFTSAGQPMTFGYVLTNGGGTSSGYTAVSGIDNWSVTINSNFIYLPLLQQPS